MEPTHSPKQTSTAQRGVLQAASIALLFLIASAMTSSAQTFTSLLSFAGTDGSQPFSSLIQGADGNFYGTTTIGGSSTVCSFGCGTVFMLTPAGVLTTLYSFVGTDGAFPVAGLVQANDGNFYGTTFSGGSLSCSGGCGTIFKITPAGMLTTLHTFTGTDGNGPSGALIQVTDGELYGITTYGGANICTGSPGCGTVFKITLSGALNTLHYFSGADGSAPLDGLIQATNGKLYGTTGFGGANNVCGTNVGCGTVFSMTSGGTLSTLYSFCAQSGCRDGTGPNTRLVQGTDGKFYGTTFRGGISDFGTVFSLTAAGELRTLHRFIGQDGFDPAELIQAADGNFYGTAKFGGNTNCPSDCGTVFKITTRGVTTSLHRFYGNDGANPYGGLLQAADGTFYGTTAYGGANGDGTIFSLAVTSASF